VDTAGRLRLITDVLQRPPQVHDSPTAVNGVWSSARSAYDYIADVVADDARTLETGCGVSTVLLAAWAEHMCVTYDPAEQKVMEAYLGEDERTSARPVRFEIGSSHEVLPRLADDGPLDFVFVDGCHGWPMAIIDWFYAADRLREGGVAMIDDRDLPSVSLGLMRFLDQDPRWKREMREPRWAAYRKVDSHSLVEEWRAQAPFLGSSRRIAAQQLIPERLRPAARAVARKLKLA
jgi:hypothetical protein